MAEETKDPDGAGRQNESGPVQLSQTKARTFLKHTHSLEIADFVGADDSMDLTAPMHEVFDTAATPEMFGDINSEDLDIWCDWLDEVTPISPQPSSLVTPSKCNTTPDQPSIAMPHLNKSQGYKRRTSQKEKIQNLRSTVSELSQKLEGLKAATPTCSPLPTSVASQHVASILEQPRSLWKRVASRQLMLRHKAEEENAKLRELVASHRRTARCIRRMFRRRINDELLEDRSDSRRPKMTNNEQVFRDLLLGVDRVYDDLGKLYEAKGVPEVRCPGRKRLVYANVPDSDLFVEFIDKDKVPFDSQRSESAVWKFLQGPRVCGRKRVCEKELEQTTDTIKSCVGFKCPENGKAAYVLELRVARKYVEESRTVFIRRTIADPTMKDPWASSLKFVETMVIVVSVGKRLSSGQDTSVIESYLSVSRYAEGSSALSQQPSTCYVDLVANGWDRKMTFNSQEIENLLFEESVSTAE